MRTESSQVSRRGVLRAGMAAGLLAAGTSAAGAATGAAVDPRRLTAPDAALLRLADRLARLEEDGLDPRAYGVPDPALADRDPAAWRAAVERAAIAALTDLLQGRVRELPGRIDLRRDLAARPLGPWLAELAAAPDPAAIIDRAALLPPDAAALKQALAAARQRLANPLPTVPAFAAPADTLEPGGSDPVRVPALRARLAATDPAVAAAPPAEADPALYTDDLVAAARRFQATEGLEADGRIGRFTLAALNRSAEGQVRQLRVALDMRRAAPALGAERRIDVNLATQRLQVVEAGRVLADMAVIVGRPTRATPLLRVRLTAIQFNPPWGVPERNAREDLLPKFRANPQAMMNKGFRVYGMVDGERVQINPLTIDWRSVQPATFPYVIRQDAGDANALGRIKFVIPNGDDIFMHDTPDRHLFRRGERAFSSGCIRLEKPMELMRIALEGTPGWDVPRAERAIASRATSMVTVANPIPVRMHYTAVVVEGGDVRIRPDIYGFDEAYARALDARTTRIAAMEAR